MGRPVRLSNTLQYPSVRGVFFSLKSASAVLAGVYINVLDSLPTTARGRLPSSTPPTR